MKGHRSVSGHTGSHDGGSRPRRRQLERLRLSRVFRGGGDPLIDGARLGVLVMLGVLFAVQGAFAGFFLYLRNRAKRIAEIDLDTEWSELQGGASRT